MTDRNEQPDPMESLRFTAAMIPSPEERRAQEATLERLEATYLAERESAGLAPLSSHAGGMLSRHIRDLNGFGHSEASQDLPFQFFAAYPALNGGRDEICDVETVDMFRDWWELNHERVSLEWEEGWHAEQGERLREKRARLEAEGKIRPRTD